MSDQDASNIRSSAGSRLLVCGSLPVTYNEAGFAALTWSEVAEVTDIPEFGRTYSPVTHTALARRRAIKRKGSFDEGDMTIPMGRDAQDAGQKILKQAELSDDSFAFAIELQDGTRFYFTAQCMSYRTTIGGTDAITGRTANLAIDNDILEVTAVSFTLKYVVPQDKGSLVGLAEQTVLRGGAGKPVFAQAGAGFTFTRWDDSKTDNPRSDSGVVANLTVTAEFAAA